MPKNVFYLQKPFDFRVQSLEKTLITVKLKENERMPEMRSMLCR